MVVVRVIVVALVDVRSLVGVVGLIIWSVVPALIGRWKVWGIKLGLLG